MLYKNDYFSLFWSRGNKLISWFHDFLISVISHDFRWFHLISGDFEWFQNSLKTDFKMISSWFKMISMISIDFSDFRWFLVISLILRDFNDFTWFQMISSDFQWFQGFQLISDRIQNYFQNDFRWFQWFPLISLISKWFRRLKSVCSPLFLTYSRNN